MKHTVSRRRALTALGATSAAVAGCLGSLSDDGPGDGDETDDDGPGDADETDDDVDGGSAGTGGTDPMWPAIDAGELVSDFEDLDRWYPQRGTIEAAPDEARSGSQAAVLESDERTAGMSIRFPDGIDFEGWDTSLAVKPEAASRIVVEFIAPTREERLNTVRPISDGFDDWFRLDCGYEHKPEGEPDLSNVTRLNIVAVGPEDGPTRLLVDDLRRTEAVDNGKAILAFYGGHGSHFEIAADRLEKRGWAGAVPVDPRRVGDRGRMDFDQLRRLRDRGWDVCSYPRADRDLTEQPEDRKRAVVESVRDSLAERGFEDGSRHFFAPEWRRMTPDTLDVVREYHESGFLFGSCPTGAPPTGIHTTPVIWGPALHNGVRRHINLCDQYRQLTVIRVPRIVEGEASDDSMSLEDFEHLLDHIENRGLDVITPSDVVDGMDVVDAGAREETLERPDGVILEPGRSHSFRGPDDLTEFDLDEGIVTARFSHEGESAFDVALTPTDGGRDEKRLVTTAGDTGGESIETVREGTYRLEVDADGPWSIDLEQPEVHGDDLETPPIAATGSGSGFVGPLWAEDGLNLAVTHDGDSEFVVDGRGVDGSRERIVDDRGEFDASRSYGGSGVVWLDVEADGDWTIDGDS